MESIIGPDGRTYLPMPQTKITRPNDELPIGRISSPWKVYGRTLGIVILFIMVHFVGVSILEGSMPHPRGILSSVHSYHCII